MLYKVTKIVTPKQDMIVIRGKRKSTITLDSDSKKKIRPRHKFFNDDDRLALPLLIDLRQKANLPPSSCFTRLPADLKLEILDLLPGADVAKVACVSQELHFLSSNDDLWKKKTLEKFEKVDIPEGESSWKHKFVKALKSERRRRICMHYGEPSYRFICEKPHLVPLDEEPLSVPICEEPLFEVLEGISRHYWGRTFF